MLPVFALLFLALLAALSCDKEPAQADSPVPSVAAPPPALPAPESATQAPEIIVDHMTTAVGKDRVPVGESGLADRVAVLVAGRPGIEGRAAEFVAMRNVKPSQVAAVLDALRRGKASSAVIKSEARGGTTAHIAVSFATSAPDCTTAAWIAKDGSIAVWPAGGGVAKRVLRGLAGPDMTLGLAAIRERSEGCAAPDLIVGADDKMPWGVVFDLAEDALSAPGARTSAVILVAGAAPGHKVMLR